MSTPFHASYWAHSLLLAHPHDRIDALSRSIGNARVDLNPHQIDAALFALRSPYSKGVLLAESDRIRREQDGLIAQMEGQLKSSTQSLSVLFRLQWKLSREGA